MKLFKKNFQILFKLATPLILASIIHSSVYFFITIFLAHIHHKALAAGSLVGWLFGTINVTVLGILNSINILISNYHGAQNDKGISLVFRDGFWLACILALPMGYFLWNISPLLLYLKQNEVLVGLTETYLHALIWGLLAHYIMFVFMEFFIGMGKTKVAFAFNVLYVFLTILFDFVLIFGKFGFPALGIAGAGWGATISVWITVIIYSIYVFKHKNYKHYTRLLFSCSKPCYLIELLKIGIPLGIMYCVEVSSFFILTLIMGSLDGQLLAANQIILQYLNILIAMVFSIAQAITVRMGYLLGAGKILAAKQTAFLGIFISFTFMLCAALIYWYLPTFLITVDFDIHAPQNQKVVHFAIQLLAVSALFQMIESIRISLFGALRALKDTRFTLYVSIIGFWVIALPIGYFLAVPLHLKGIGLWWGMIIGTTTSVLLLYWRFNSKMLIYRSRIG